MVFRQMPLLCLHGKAPRTGFYGNGDAPLCRQKHKLLAMAHSPEKGISSSHRWPKEYKLLAHQSNRDWMHKSGLWQAYKNTQHIAPANLALVNEFIENHGKYGGKIQGQMLCITPAIFSHVLEFPCEGYDLFSARRLDTKELDSCFLHGARKGIGYDISLAQDPAFQELLFFIFDRIVMKSNLKFRLTTAICLAGLRVRFGGAKFNWSAYICSKMMLNIRAIKEGKSSNFKYACYLSRILEYHAQTFLVKACISHKSERQSHLAVEIEQNSSFKKEKQSRLDVKMERNSSSSEKEKQSLLAVKTEQNSTCEKEKSVMKEEFSDQKLLTWPNEVVYLSSDDDSESELKARSPKLKCSKTQPDFVDDTDFEIVSEKDFQDLLKKPPSCVVQKDAFSKKTEKDEEEDTFKKLEEMCNEKDDRLKRLQRICEKKDETLQILGIKYEEQTSELCRTTEALLNARRQILDLSQKINAGYM